MICPIVASRTLKHLLTFDPARSSSSLTLVRQDSNTGTGEISTSQYFRHDTEQLDPDGILSSVPLVLGRDERCCERMIRNGADAPFHGAVA